MDKHTFKVGDLVTCHGVRTLCPDDTKAVVVGLKQGFGCEQIWIESLDEKFNDINGYFCEKEVHSYLKHDNDFHVGDWVRYEAVEPYTKGYDTEDGKVGQITHLGQEVATIKGELDLDRFISNLVKIQPPQEEKNMDNVFNITHEKYGVVQGVHQVAPGCYCKNGAYYYRGEGWGETEEWVKIEVLKRDWDQATKHDSKYMLIGGYGVLYREVK